MPLYLQLSGHRQLACHPSPSATPYHVISSFGPPALHPDSDRLWDAARMEGHGQGCPCLQKVGWCQELNPQAPGSPSRCLGPGGMNLHYCSQLLRPAGVFTCARVNLAALGFAAGWLCPQNWGSSQTSSSPRGIPSHFLTKARGVTARAYQTHPTSQQANQTAKESNIHNEENIWTIIKKAKWEKVPQG